MSTALPTDSLPLPVMAPTAPAPDDEAQRWAALLELVGKLASADSLQQAAERLVEELREFTDCRTVVVGWRGGSTGGCRLLGVSTSRRFDRRSPLGRQLEATLDEALLRESLTCWPPRDDSDRPGTLLHQKLAQAAEAAGVLSFPLRDSQDRLVGVVLLLSDAHWTRRETTLKLAQRAAEPLGTALELVQRAQPGFARRLGKQLRQYYRTWQALFLTAIVGLALLSLTVRTPYRLRCTCEVQPTTRRFVAAPFDATLERCLVSPGDQVREGQVLARLDGREIRWELAGLAAEYNRAAKERDAAMAARNAGSAQMARLEMERLQLKTQLLENRAQNLEIRSPLSGVVISGDLVKAEGAPLTLGQTMFEIAPLEAMVVEVAVPQAEIRSVRCGADTLFRLDSLPGRVFQGTISRLHPRAELKEDEQVFVAEVLVANPDELLHPGMKGQARIVGPSRSLGWQWFHKPWYALLRACWW